MSRAGAAALRRRRVAGDELAETSAGSIAVRLRRSQGPEIDRTPRDVVVYCAAAVELNELVAELRELADRIEGGDA